MIIMDLRYKELYEKYRTLEQENKQLKDEIILLKKSLSKEDVEAYNSVDHIIIKPGLFNKLVNDVIFRF